MIEDTDIGPENSSIS
jgi:magnesium-transporting ATPase (P-type)